MPRRLLVLLVLALVPAMALSAGAAVLEDRSPLEATPERRIEFSALDVRDQLDAATNARFDVTHYVQRISTGWEAGIMVDVTVGDRRTGARPPARRRA